MKQNRKMRLISLVMVFAMLLSYIPGTVWAVDSTTDIKAIEKPTGISIVEDYDDYVGADWLNQLGLPTSVTVTLANNSKQAVPVTWDTSKLDTRTTGYYSLPGTVILPDGATNGQNLDVSITVLVREYKNLIKNPSFEENLTGWYVRGANPAPKLTDVIAADGKYSAMVGGSVSYGNASIADTRNSIVTQIECEGQYYFGAKAQYAAAAYPAGASLQAKVLYKTTTNSSSTTINGSKVTVGNTQFAQSTGIVELPANTNWIRLDLYMVASSTVNHSAGQLCFDDAELVPLKLPLKVEPSAIAEIKTEILSHKVIQNYPDYVGENWKEELGLPNKVEIVTDTGAVAEVEVTWSYAGLDFTKYGKYTLIGKLDDSSFPNPKGITASVNIYVGKSSNLLPNPSFESDLAGWYFKGVNPAPGRVTDPVWNGKYAAHTGTWTTTAKNYSVADTRNMTEKLGEIVAQTGGGQFYYSLWMRSASETPHTDVQMQTSLLFKTKNENGTLSSSTTKYGSKVSLSNTEYHQSCGVLQMPANTAWVRLDMGVSTQNATDLGTSVLYLDNAELIAINVTIPKDQEPADVTKVLTEIPVRAVVKDYDKFVGANWKEALGLPETVEVLTSSGNTASVGVTWNFDTLKLNRVGKYILVGTLDNSAYPNPLELSVTQIISIRDYKNLILNSSFEGSYTGWYLRGANPSPSVSTAVSKLGKYSALTGKISTTYKNTSYADTRNMVNEVGAGVALQGAGQYYYSAWAQSASKTFIAGMTHEARLGYKTVDESGVQSSMITKIGDKAELNNKEFTQSKGILQMPANVNWARLDLYVYAQQADDINAAQIYLDHAELVPLNVIVEQYEGKMVQVETIISDRQIIQNYLDYIGAGYTEADLMLPETVAVKTSAGQVINVDVKWDTSKLDLTKLGTYTVYGVLDDLKISNPDGLTVQLKIKVVGKTNLFSNPSFEKDGNGWDYTSRSTIEVGITSPIRDGSFSLLFKAGRLDDVTWNYLQAFYNSGPATVGSKITQTGGGRYFFGGWAQGTASTNDIQVQLRMLYRSMASGDTVKTTSAPAIKLSTSKFTQMGDILIMPDDIYWARMDFYLLGTPAQMRLSEVYLEDFELIPLNVEIPNLTDIIDCENVADIYVHEGSTIEGLDLPKTLQVVLKNSQKFDLDVNWDTDSFDPNKIGEQTITGSLVLGTKYKNSKNFVPKAKIIVRDKNDPLRQTIYISTSGSEDNDGLSPEAPKQDVKNIPTYLAQGYNVSLKRGDVWYLSTHCFKFTGIYGTANAPLTVGAYGSGNKPRISFTKKIENSAWKLVDESRNIYAADVSDLGSKNGTPVFRCFVNDVPTTPKDRSNYVTLKEGEHCSYNGTLYVRMPKGEVPKNVDAMPYNVGDRARIEDVSYLTFENIHFKGSGGVNNQFWVEAPTEHLRFMYCDMTHVSGHAMQWDTTDDDTHYKPEIAYCYIDSSITEAEGNIPTGPWGCGHLEGITMRDGIDGAWLHHIHMRQFSHAFIAFESNDKDSSYTITGMRNCIVEDNLLEGGYAKYARAFNICGGYNQSGKQMCYDNIFRRNKCYDMTTSSHLYGENNLVYSNLISYVHCNYLEDGTLFDGKAPQPFGFDTKPYSDHVSYGNMLINNTFYNVGGVINVQDKAYTVSNNIYANNLAINWTSDTAANGAFYDDSVDIQYVMNNGVFSTIGMVDPFVVDNKIYSAADVNDSVAGYSGNISADPMFVNADLNNMQHGARLDFTLSAESPMRYAGLPLYDDIYKTFPMWEKLVADYTDINGVAYLAESPSIGAFSFSDKVRGDVAEVGKLDDILARPGAKFEQLNLPASVTAKNDQGVEVVLLTTWSDANFDSSKPGTITLTAQLRNGPHTDLTIGDAVATININIKDKMELLNVTTPLKDITVLYGTSFEDAVKQLPSVLDVQEESGFKESLPVTWSCADYNPTKPDVYTFKCILPADMLTNVREFPLEVQVRLMHEIGRGMELLINPDFIDGTSAAPWTMGWGTGTIKVTTDPEYLYPGEPASMIVTSDGRYGSLQQNVLGQVQLMGDGKYLYKMYMRAYDPARPIDSSVACLKVTALRTYTEFCRAKTNINENWVEYSAVMDIYDVEDAAEIMFHTSTYKSEDDVKDPKSYVVAGCSLIYLGKTDAEVEATLDSIDLVWNAIKGANEKESNVMSDLKLPSKIGTGSTIKWTSSDESAITNDGKVTMGRVPKTVTMTATITYNGKQTIKKFTVTVPRNPDLPTFTGTLTGAQGAVKVGDEFKVTISLSSDKATAFNAYRFTVSFNASKLEYVGISDSTSTVDVEGGKLTISGIGTERPVTDTITLTFKAKKSGITEVKLVKVEMDTDPDVTLDTLPTMTVENGTFLVDVQKLESEDKETADVVEKDNSVVIWIVIGLVAAALIAGGVLAIILIKKKKQLPPATEE